MAKKALGEIVKGVRGIILGKNYECIFIQAAEIYMSDKYGNYAQAVTYVETEELAKVFISQQKDTVSLRYRKVLMIKLEDQYLVGELDLVKIEKTGELKEKLLCGIKSKLTKEEIDFIFGSIGQGTE